MRFYVVGLDGSKYGPADMATLQQWAAEQRITGETTLEQEGTGAIFLAKTVPGLFSQSTAYAPPQQPTAPQMGQVPYSPYARVDGPGMMYDNGQSDVNRGWVYFALGLLCCPLIFQPLAMRQASIAEKKGHQKTKVLFYLSLTFLIVQVIFFAIRLISASSKLGGF